ncbi:peptidase family m20 m25 m40 protein [Sarocladium implicatum]|nr:peptidase family m20 m25 m40 protein [Sarocladium implicatum]
MAVPEESPVPLRPEQLGKRESRLGIRSLFSRKGSKEPESPEPARTTRNTARSAGIRASLADMSNWSYGQQPVRPDVKDPSTYISRPLSTTVEHPTIEEMQSRAQLKGRVSRQPTKPSTKGGLVAWDAPPLFKAYPQAIKHATLPASILSPDTILRMRSKKGEGAGEQPMSPDLELATESELEKNKKKKGRSTASPEIVTEWTTKIYLLVTSGCLLQYSSEGTFDRLPEKVLQLGKASAAFVSDAIPGRHWVLQISSALEADGSVTSDQRSLFSRLPFRVAERRQASNFLMVFENADEMDGWLATLRREIEGLGGKKALSETGKPRVHESTKGLREQTSQRTLVVRDPDRYSRRFSVASSWREGSEAGDYETFASPGTRDQSLDGTSVTNSVVSQDGRQLDNLRDSSHRLSSISFGQRTVVTSDGSSPSSSPTRDSFPSSEEEDKFPQELPHIADSRLRPNASAIVHRRRSLQTMGPFVDGRGAPQGAARPPSTMLSSPIPEAAVTSTTNGNVATPNFSVPHSSNRRFSYMKPTPEHVTPLAPPPRPSARKVPPPLNIGRPLSMVIDQPSPHGEVPQRPATRHGDEGSAPTTTTTTTNTSATRLPKTRRDSVTSTDSTRQLAAKRSSLASLESINEFGIRPQPRRLASMSTLRSPGGWSRPESHQAQALPAESNRMDQSAMEGCNDALSSPPRQVTKRASMFTVLPERMGRRNRRSEVPLPYAPESLPEPSPPPTAPLPPLPTAAVSNKHLQNARTSQLLSRRSLPSLVEGPPPAPPPSCALPPIPQRPSVKA